MVPPGVLAHIKFFILWSSVGVSVVQAREMDGRVTTIQTRTNVSMDECAIKH